MTPLSVAPHIKPDETITSWINRLSAANHYPVITILHHLGLIETETWKAVKGGHDFLLTPTEQDNIRETTGSNAGPNTITENYKQAGFLTPLTSRSDLRAWAITNPVWVSKSMHCPLCLKEEPVWKTEWKLPYLFACPTHNVFLIATCPGCGWGSKHHYRDGSTRPFLTSRIAAPGHCPAPQKPGTTHTGRYSTPCNYDLTQTPPQKAAKSLIDAQQALLDEFTQNHDWGWWKDLQILTGIAYNYATTQVVKKLHPAKRLPQQLLTAWTEHSENLVARYDAGLKRTNISYEYNPHLNALAIPIAHQALTDNKTLQTLSDQPKLHLRQTPAHTRIRTAKPSPTLNAKLPWRRTVTVCMT